jgi:uncharacterized membrane protein
LFGTLFIAALPTGVQAQDSVVRAVLFFSPSCPHCHTVINEILPPLMEQYGEQLNIVNVDISQVDGQAVFMAALQKHGIPVDQAGVPLLIVGEEVLIGSLQIPAEFPGLITEYLANGGIDWPAIPGLVEFLDLDATVPANLSWQQKYMQDPLGNTLSVLMLALMLVAVGRTFYLFSSRKARLASDPPAWVVPVLTVVGIVVASYLAFVESTNSAAICGPIGDCNTVQQSQYAVLFGLLPVGVLGLIGYAGLAVAWIFQQFGPPEWKKNFTLAIWLMAFIGTMFSLYLTFLEPFVIGATCMWCLTSALVMTILLWATTPPAVRAWHNVQPARKSQRRTRHA